MANNLDSNTSKKVIRVFLDAFESSRVLTKTVDTQLFQGQFTPQFGDTIDIKRPHQYNVRRTTGGDISTGVNNSIISGNAKATVQEYFTAKLDWTNLEEAIQLDQLEEIVAPAARQIVTDLEVDFGKFMTENAGLLHGTVGTGAGTWNDVAGAKALLGETGVPKNRPWYYVMSEFSEIALANQQATTISPASGELVKSAWDNAMIGRPLGGMQTLSSNALYTLTQGDNSDRAGTLASTPDGTYVTHKDSMIQTLNLAGLGLTETVNPGEVIVFDDADTYTRLNVSTRQPMIDAAGAAQPWSCVVVTGGTTDGSGNLTVTVASAAINETDGQYNNIKTALTSGAAFTIQGTANAVIKPSLFYHEQAFSIATVPIPKLHTWDTRFTTEDGFSIRMTKYSDGDKNEQSLRFDLLPAYGVLNPLFAGQGWG